MKNKLNVDVTNYLKEQIHPLFKEIQLLRKVILESSIELDENIKWKAPNYLYEGEDRVTMRIHPPKEIQIIFHRGAKVKKQPNDRLIADEKNMLIWKENDRAILTLKDMNDIKEKSNEIQKLIKKWIIASKN